MPVRIVPVPVRVVLARVELLDVLVLCVELLLSFVHRCDVLDRGPAADGSAGRPNLRRMSSHSFMRASLGHLSPKPRERVDRGGGSDQPAVTGIVSVILLERIAELVDGPLNGVLAVEPCRLAVS